MTPNCPACNRPCAKRRKTIRKLVVWVCRECTPNRYKVEGSPHWLLDDGTAPILEALRWAAREVALERAKYKAMMESRWDDPRWTTFTWY